MKRDAQGLRVGSVVVAALGETVCWPKPKSGWGQLHSDLPLQLGAEGGQLGKLELETRPYMRLPPQGDSLGRLQAALQLQKSKTLEALPPGFPEYSQSGLFPDSLNGKPGQSVSSPFALQLAVLPPSAPSCFNFL